VIRDGVRIIAVASLAALAGCFVTAQPVVMSPRASTVRVGKSDPPLACQDLGPIEAVHGSGCGGFGARGDYHGAYNVLRNQAAGTGGNYVRMDVQLAPHSEHGCFDNRYVIRGIVYACPATAFDPAPAPAPMAAPAPAAAPAPVPAAAPAVAPAPAAPAPVPAAP
jgi:hypothetical protein